MRDKIIIVVVLGGLAIAFATGMIPYEPVIGWVRHVFYRAKGSTAVISNPVPTTGNVGHAVTCRENLHRIQAAKRKAAFDRGQHIGPITWEEVLRAMPTTPAGKLRPDQINNLIPKCPARGSYTLGTMEEVPRCTTGGGNTLTLDDDHVIRD